MRESAKWVKRTHFGQKAEYNKKDGSMKYHSAFGKLSVIGDEEQDWQWRGTIDS